MQEAVGARNFHSSFCVCFFVYQSQWERPELWTLLAMMISFVCVSVFGCIAQTRSGSVEGPWSKRSKVQTCQGIGRGCATLVWRNQGLRDPWLTKAPGALALLH